MTTSADPEGEYLDAPHPTPEPSDEYARYVAAAITKARGHGALEEARAAIAATHRYIIEGGKK